MSRPVHLRRSNDTPTGGERTWTACGHSVDSRRVVGLPGEVTCQRCRKFIRDVEALKREW